MISSLRGTVLAAMGTTLVVEIGGVGLSVNVTPQLALAQRVGSPVMLRTALIVREDDLSLFGFADAEELVVFDLLRGVTGVGPKSAMGVLAAMTPVQIAQAVAVEDDAAFRKVSGIGPKTAKLIVVSLAGKLIAPVGASNASTSGSSITQSVVAALVGLGWPERTAAEAADAAVETATLEERTVVQAILRLALAHLGPNARSGA